MGPVVVDKGDLATPIPETRAERDPRKKYIREIARVCQRLYAQVYRAHEEGALPIVLGGDHSLGAGSVGASADYAAAHGEEIGVLWVDAHGDMNTPATTTSVNVHGMPLAALLGPEPAELSRIGARSPKIRAEKTVLIGVRNLDDQEKQAIRDSRVQVFTMEDIDRHGIAAVMKRAIAIASKGTRGIHVSFDLDVCDPTIAPGVGTPVKGGLDYREAHMVMEMIADSNALLGLDLVEINPILERLHVTHDGGVRVSLREPWRDGTTDFVFDPVDFLGRLAVLVPRPRINLILYYGTLGARAGRRPEVVRRVSAEASLVEPARTGDGAAAVTDHEATRRADGRGWRWAALMRRTFGFDVLACPRCGGRLRLIALIEDAAVIVRILRHLGLPDTIPSPRPARAPPATTTAVGGDDEFTRA